MELDIHGKQIDVGDALRGHVETKLDEIKEEEEEEQQVEEVPSEPAEGSK